METAKQNSHLSSSSKIVQSITLIFLNNADLTKSKQREKYFRYKVKSYGYTNPEIYSIYNKTLKHYSSYNNLNQESKFNLAIAFINESFYEHKLISSCILGEIHKKLTKNQLEILKKTIKEGAINEWATCD